MKQFLGISLLLLTANATPALAVSFAEFDEKAKKGERLNVVFFGSSLTWGANASDPQLTSYRAIICDRLEKAYPKAHFKFWDASMGGTNSQLGVFRLERDVLSRRPDLVFIDFSANDDLATTSATSLAAYESIIRRLIVDAKTPVVLAILPFEWNVSEPLDKLKRRTAHLAIAKAYQTAVADAVALCRESVSKKKAKLSELWPFDRVHPGDRGYELFANAVWSGFADAISKKLVCVAPKEMIYGDTYMSHARVPLWRLPKLPAGWQKGEPLRNSAYYDMLMSRWLDGVLVATNRKLINDNQGKIKSVPQQVDRLRIQFKASDVLLLGESTEKSSKYRIYLDGKLIERDGKKEKLKEFDASWMAYLLRGNTHLVQVVAEGLNSKVVHTIEIEPVFSPKMIQEELRLESICLAGGEATVIGLEEEKKADEKK